MELAINWRALRSGQQEAIETIETRVREGERFTAIVLPTRYGKSDVVRVAAMRLWHAGLISTTLVVSPNTYLKKQMVKQHRFAACVERYSIGLNEYKYGRLDRAALPFSPNGEQFLSTTMQLLNDQVGVFCQWVDREIRTFGRPPLICIDEAHTGSEDNSWGQAVKQMADRGAYVVLLTATPLRSDGRRIPGFEFRSLEIKPVRVAAPNKSKEAPDGYVWVDFFEGTRERIELIAHHATTFREAWAAEDPPTLCKISRVPFDVELEEYTEGEVLVGRRLSELEPRESRRHLGRLCRNKQVIARGCADLLKDLHEMQKNTPDTAAIVFCGNDTQGDNIDNQHANDIEAAIKELDPTMRCIIATTSVDEDAANLIEDFADRGIGDILIVKQMASLGLDARRLKVCLDLSNVRTAASFIQRVMRVCTVYNKVRLAVYIVPDDVVGRALWEELVTGQQGEARISDLTLVEEQLVKVNPETHVYVDVDGTLTAPFEDSDLNKAEAGQLEPVREIIKAFPALLSYYSHAEIAIRSQYSGLSVNKQQTTELPTAGLFNTTDKVKELKRDNLKLAQLVTRRRIGDPYDRDRYPDTIREVWNDHKARLGVPLSTKVDNIRDIKTLERLKDSLQGERDGKW